MNLKHLSLWAVTLTGLFLASCSEDLIPNVQNPSVQALLPNVNASCSESNPASSCLNSFNGKEAQVLLFEKTDGNLTDFNSCANVQAAIEGQSFNLSPLAVGRANLSCTDNGSTTSCSLQNNVAWEDASENSIFLLAQDTYIALTVFKTDDDTTVDQPEPGDYIQCLEFELDSTTVDNDLMFNSSTDTLAINWPFSAIPTLAFSCTESANADCTIAQNADTVEYSFYQDVSCSTLQAGIENALITAEQDIVGTTTAACLDNATDSCSAGSPVAWTDGQGSAVTQILAGNYAVLAHVGDPSGFPVQGDVVSCQDLTMNSTVTAVSLADAQVFNINWPTLATIEQVDMSCSTTGSTNCSVASINSNMGIQGYVKDQTCAQVITALESGNEDALNFHAQGAGTAACVAGSPDTCSMSISSWESGVEGGPSSLTEVPQGSYAVISFVDQLGEDMPSPGDVLHCKNVTLSTTSIGNIVLDNDDIVEPDFPIIFTPSLTATCDNSAGGTSDCIGSLNGQDANYLFFENVTCTSLLSGVGPNFTLAATVSASCDASSPTNTCTQTVTDSQWENDSSTVIRFIEKGTYAVAGFINADGLGDGPEAGDPVWCTEMVFDSSTTSITLSNSDLRSL